MEKVYIQTYSLGSAMHEDFAGSLKKLSEIGYYGVEFAGGYGGNDAKQLKKLLEDYKLDAICSHVGIDKAEGDIALLAEVGARYIVCPMAMIATYDEAMKIAESLNELGKKCAAAGLKYGYHNHTQEFAEVNGKYILDHLIDNTDPTNVIFELDVGWCTTAGVNAVDYINKHAGRFELIHAKEASVVTGVQPPIDFSKIQVDAEGNFIITDEMKAAMAEAQKMNAPQGKGIVDWKAVKAAADAQGAQAYIVEREWDYLNDIFQCVKEDYAFMKTV